MKLLPDARRGRPLAVLLLLVALVLVYGIFIHFPFVDPLLEARSELIELRDEEARFRATAQQRKAIDERLAAVRAFEAGNPGFLVEANFDLAASALIQRLQEQVNVLGAGERCLVVSRTPFRNRGEEPFERVTVKVRMRCEMEHFVAVVHGLESGSPQLFVAELGITSRRGVPQPGQAPSGYLDIAFDLYGYLRNRGGEP
jgi:general secretion pathway protein M